MQPAGRYRDPQGGAHRWVARATILLARRERLDVVLVAVTGALVVWSAGLAALPASHLGTVAPAYDLIFDTFGLLTTLAVAFLGWIRFGETSEPRFLWRTAAFLVLALPNAVHLIVLATDADVAAGMSLVDQGQAPIYAFAIARIVGALLLVPWLGFDPLPARRRAAQAIVLVPVAVVAAIMALVVALPGAFPELGVAATVATSADAPAAPTIPGTVVAAVAAGLFLAAAIASRQHYLRGRAIDDAYLTVGLIVGAFSQLDAALHPTYAGLVTVGDLLRLGFYVVLLLGLVAQGQAGLRALAASNKTLARLKDVEADRAALEERTRISRELHDGLAQALWFVKLKATRLESLDELPTDARALAGQVARGVDETLDAARQAVVALRVGGSRDDPLSDMLAKTVDEFQDRYGIRTELRCPADLSRLEVRTEAELLRICQEALANVAHHADATAAWVAVEVIDDRLTLSVRDNGRGFDASRTLEGHFGLPTMRERAAIVGGTLTIESQPQAGTRVAISLPLAARPRLGRLVWP